MCGRDTQTGGPPEQEACEPRSNCWHDAVAKSFVPNIEKETRTPHAEQSPMGKQVYSTTSEGSHNRQRRHGTLGNVSLLGFGPRDKADNKISSYTHEGNGLRDPRPTATTRCPRKGPFALIGEVKENSNSRQRPSLVRLQPAVLSGRPLRPCGLLAKIVPLLFLEPLILVFVADSNRVSRISTDNCAWGN